MNKPFAVTSPSDAGPRAASVRLQRVEGASRIAFTGGAGGSRLARLFQSGSAKIRLPNAAAGQPAQAVLINSAGGLTGGDRLSVAVEMGEGARAAFTTQACEKVYRSVSGEAEVSAALRLAEGARLDWLPQETILFDGGRLRRRLDADLAAGATLLACEAVVFGRAARGEAIRSGLFRERWRIRRQGRLIHADDLHFDWAADAALLRRPAVLAGGGAMATILWVADAPESCLESLRRIIGPSGGASAWNGKLLARIVADGGAALRRVLLPALERLSAGAALPRIWLT